MNRRQTLIAAFAWVAVTLVPGAWALADDGGCDCRSPRVLDTRSVLGPTVAETLPGRLGWPQSGDLAFPGGRLVGICVCPSMVVLRGVEDPGQRAFRLVVVPTDARVEGEELRLLAADPLQRVHVDLPPSRDRDAELLRLARLLAPLPWQGAGPRPDEAESSSSREAGGDSAPSALLGRVLGLLLLLLTAGATVFVLREALPAARQAGSGRLLFAVVSILALSVALRVAFASPWPADQTEVVRAHINQDVLGGAGSSLFYPMVRSFADEFTDPVRVFAWVDLGLSAIAPVLLLLLVTLVAGSAAGVLAGLLLAADPVHIRLAMGADAGVAYTFLALAATLQLELAIRRGARSSAAAAGVLWALTIGMRPESLILLVIPFLRIVVDRGAYARLRDGRWVALFAAPLVLLLAIKVPFLWSSWSGSMAKYSGGDTLARLQDTVAAIFTRHEVFRLPLLALLAPTALLFLGPRRAAPFVVPALVCPALVLQATLWDDRFSGYRYFLAYLPFLLASLASVATVLDRRWPALLDHAAPRWGLAALLALLPAALLHEGRDDLTAETVFGLEHEFLAANADAVTAPSLVTTYHSDGEHGSEQLEHHLRAAGLPVRRLEAPPTANAGAADRPFGVQLLTVPPLDPALLDLGVPVYYYRGWLENRPKDDERTRIRALHETLEASFVLRPVRCRATPAFASWMRDARDIEPRPDASRPMNQWPRPVYENCLYRLYPKPGGDTP